MYIIKKNNINAIVDALAETHDVYGPVKDIVTGDVSFGPASVGIDLSAGLPLVPPKQILFPQKDEVMRFNYDREKGAVDTVLPEKRRPAALFGIRSCDAAAITCLDRFFLGQEFVDSIYLEHRKGMFIAVNTCITPFENCFCVCTDSGPEARDGYDISMTDIGDWFFIECGSRAGEEIISACSYEKAGDTHRALKNEAVERAIHMFENHAVNSRAWLSRAVNRVTTGLIDEKVWEYIGDRCYECGGCSFVCPTCSCFNIEDVSLNERETSRLRMWDSCSYAGYSRMAGGHNPRQPVEDRRNKRFFCKLSYSQSKKYLRPSCVGCGRCVTVCPGNIAMPAVVNILRRGIEQS